MSPCQNLPPTCSNLPQTKLAISKPNAGVAPLADRIRPIHIDQVIGQKKLLGEGGALRTMLQANALTSLIFWGPPGVGKTTLARLLADQIDGTFTQISAVFSGVADLKKVFDAARLRQQNGTKTLLFVDEIHRFNKAQQDSFLPYVEDGTIILVGATTENPSFELNSALLSRTPSDGFGTAIPGGFGIDSPNVPNRHRDLPYRWMPPHAKPYWKWPMVMGGRC